jgi:hypothetical protein
VIIGESSETQRVELREEPGELPGGRGDAAAEGAWLGVETDRPGVRLQPPSGEAIYGGGRVCRLPAAAAAEDARRS